MLSRRIILSCLIFGATACSMIQTSQVSQLNIGIVNYEASDRSIEKYSDFQTYLGTELKSIINLEPTYNEVQALRRIVNNKWDLVFAPSGLAAIAVDQHNYLPVVPLEGINNNRSVIVVRQDANFQKRQDLMGEVIALGQVGSAMGYYLPIYNLYGLVFAEIMFAPTAKTGMSWVESGKVAATALSLADFNRYRQELGATKFRVLYLDNHKIPSGAIVIRESMERFEQEQIKKVLTDSPSHIAASAQFLKDEELPNYRYLLSVIKRVEAIAANIREKPAKFYQTNSPQDDKPAVSNELIKPNQESER